MKDRIKNMMSNGITGPERVNNLICLTLSSPVMPFGRVNPFQPKKIVSFFGMDRVNPFQPPKIVAYEGQN
jgi:hypothetical protein